MTLLAEKQGGGERARRDIFTGTAPQPTQANKTFEWKKVNAFLREKGVTLISAGLDEVPMVYKNIHEVMAAQKDLVTILGQFDPKLVKMAPHGERAED